MMSPEASDFAWIFVVKPPRNVRALARLGPLSTPMEGAYGNQERHPGRFAGGA